MNEKDIQEKISKLKQQITFWETGAKNSRSPVQVALFNEKIIDAKRQIRDLENKLPAKEVKDYVDAPVIADRKKDNKGNLQTKGLSGDSTVYSMKI